MTVAPRDDRQNTRRMGTGRLLEILGIGGMVMFCAAAFTPLPNVLSRGVTAPPQWGAAEAIVVLGGGVWPDGVLGGGSMRRMLEGILLHRRGLAPLLVFLGPGSEAEIRAALARELGTHPAAILTVADARTTQEEALRADAVLRGRGVRKILLVTEAHHMARARLSFERAGFEVLAAPTVEVSGGATQPAGRLALMRRLLEEWIGRLYYRLAGDG